MSEDSVTYHYDRKGKLPVTNEMAEFEASIQRRQGHMMNYYADYLDSYQKNRGILW